MGPFISMVAFSVVIAVIIIALLNYRLKKRIIELGQIDENSLKFLTKSLGSKSEALKWGLILMFGGIGLIIIEYIPSKSYQSFLPYGIEAVSLAVGFFVYYYIMRKERY